MVKNSCKIIKPLGVIEDNFYSKLMDCCYTLINKELYQVKRNLHLLRIFNSSNN